MAGLQGTGKTTAAAVGFALTEAESQLLNGGNRRLSPSNQLVTLGKQIQVPVFELEAMLTRWRLPDREWSRAGRGC